MSQHNKKKSRIIATQLREIADKLEAGDVSSIVVFCETATDFRAVADRLSDSANPCFEALSINLAEWMETLKISRDANG